MVSTKQPSDHVMAQKMLDVPAVMNPVQANGISSEYTIKCGPDISLTLRKDQLYTVILHKNRIKIEMSVEEWRTVAANSETMELGFMLMNGNFSRVDNSITTELNLECP